MILKKIIAAGGIWATQRVMTKIDLPKNPTAPLGFLRGGSPYPPRKKWRSWQRQQPSRGGCGDPPRQVAL